MTSIQDWVLAASVKGMIKSAEADGRIGEGVVIANSTIKGLFPGDDKAIKQMLVQYVILPFCRQLLKDDPDGTKKAGL